MKNKYTKPTITKVELNPEQAILGTCMSGATKVADGTTYCHSQCKAKTSAANTDSVGNS